MPAAPGLPSGGPEALREARYRAAMHVLLTERLRIRPFDADDAADADFIVALLNDPGWLRFIGDRKVRTPEDARRYLRDGPVAMLQRHGFGLGCVERRADGVAIGMCGLIRRDTLAEVDLGFAFLPAGRGQGYAREAAAAVLAQGLGPLGLARIVAITDRDNHASAHVLEAIGMRYERDVKLEADSALLRLFAIARSA